MYEAYPALAWRTVIPSYSPSRTNTFSLRLFSIDHSSTLHHQSVMTASLCASHGARSSFCSFSMSDNPIVRVSTDQGTLTSRMSRTHRSYPHVGVLRSDNPIVRKSCSHTKLSTTYGTSAAFRMRAHARQPYSVSLRSVPITENALQC